MGMQLFNHKLFSCITSLSGIHVNVLSVKAQGRLLQLRCSCSSSVKQIFIILPPCFIHYVCVCCGAFWKLALSV